MNIIDKQALLDELDAWEVKLPVRYEVEMSPTPSPKGEWYSREDVLVALKEAGIKFGAGTDNILKAKYS